MKASENRMSKVRGTLFYRNALKYIEKNNNLYGEILIELIL